MTSTSASQIQLTSSAFAYGTRIPDAYTCEGEDISPPLAWGGCPVGARSLALVCDDPDAPRGVWVHWVLFNLPVDAVELGPGVPADPELPSGARQGRNDSGRIGYAGPCPPPGKPHRYFFRLYALDINLGLQAGITKAELEAAMDQHILGQGTLMGTYQRGSGEVRKRGGGEAKRKRD
ncbi:MAG TPA: YbhB/YbcL family Raf kinase inhibitor-like protein [Gemmatimonadales bacterium]|nr:YbhB/YbcL family Raf kinase inhibitor-like protein [Gemmatimonadales bacterium]